MAKKTKWVYSSKRRASMHKAQQVHKYLVDLGKRARARGMK